MHIQGTVWIPYRNFRHGIREGVLDCGQPEHEMNHMISDALERRIFQRSHGGQPAGLLEHFIAYPAALRTETVQQRVATAFVNPNASFQARLNASCIPVFMPWPPAGL